MKHTPGPWKIRKSVLARNDFAIAAEHFIIAETFWHVGPAMFKDAEANARLIAAAPDLLAACETAVTLFEMDNETNEPGTSAWAWLQVARDAIAKARGGE